MGLWLAESPAVLSTNVHVVAYSTEVPSPARAEHLWHMHRGTGDNFL